MMQRLSTLLVAGAAIFGIVLGGVFGAFTASAAEACQPPIDNSACDNYSVSAGTIWG